MEVELIEFSHVVDVSGVREIVESKVSLRYFGLHWKDGIVIL